jgi:PAS domain S-box-containing protein
MSRGSRVTRTDQSAWQQHALECLPGLQWATDQQLKIVSSSGRDPSPSDPSDRPRPGQTLYEFFQTDDRQCPPIAAHLAALEGRTESFTCNVGGREYHGQVAPLHRGAQVAGSSAALLPLPPRDDKWYSFATTCVDFILFIDSHGKIQDVNRTARGSSRERVIGRSIFEFTPPASHNKLRSAMETVLTTGEVRTIEVRFPARFGRVTWQSMRLGPVRKAHQITGVVLMATDITQRKLAVEKLVAEEGLLRRLLDLQDRERRMVAYEIHDGFIQDVIGAKMLLQSLQDCLEDQSDSRQAELSSAITLLHRAVNEGRRLISELRPMIIDEMGIVDAIDYIISEEEGRGQLTMTFQHRVSFERLAPLLQATIYRVVQEAVINARRHGQAKRVDIRMTEVSQRYVIIEIQDDGCGFDPARIPDDRFGIAGIRERARLFGGGATIESRPGKGTRVTVKLPFEIPYESPTKLPPNWKWTV